MLPDCALEFQRDPKIPGTKMRTSVYHLQNENDRSMDIYSDLGSQTYVRPAGTSYLTKVNGKLVMARNKTPKIVNASDELLDQNLVALSKLSTKRGNEVSVDSVPMLHSLALSSVLSQSQSATRQYASQNSHEQKSAQSSAQKRSQFDLQSKSDVQTENQLLIEAHRLGFEQGENSRINSSKDGTGRLNSTPRYNTDTGVDTGLPMHVCSNCQPTRSLKHQRQHPLCAGEKSPVNYCMKCQSDATSSDSSTASNIYQLWRDIRKKRTPKNRTPSTNIIQVSENLQKAGGDNFSRLQDENSNDYEKLLGIGDRDRAFVQALSSGSNDDLRRSISLDRLIGISETREDSERLMRRRTHLYEITAKRLTLRDKILAGARLFGFKFQPHAKRKSKYKPMDELFQDERHRSNSKNTGDCFTLWRQSSSLNSSLLSVSTSEFEKEKPMDSNIPVRATDWSSAPCKGDDNEQSICSSIARIDRYSTFESRDRIESKATFARPRQTKSSFTPRYESREFPQQYPEEDTISLASESAEIAEEHNCSTPQLQRNYRVDAIKSSPWINSASNELQVVRYAKNSGKSRNNTSIGNDSAENSNDNQSQRDNFRNDYKAICCPDMHDIEAGHNDESYEKKSTLRSKSINEHGTDLSSNSSSRFGNEEVYWSDPRACLPLSSGSRSPPLDNESEYSTITSKLIPEEQMADPIGVLREDCGKAWSTSATYGYECEKGGHRWWKF